MDIAINTALLSTKKLCYFNITIFCDITRKYVNAVSVTH